MTIAEQSTPTSTTRPISVSHFQDSDILPEMVGIPPGEFLMGANDDDDKFASVLEMPRHKVEINYPFAISLSPVTFEQWDAFADNGYPAYKPDDNGWGRGRLPVCRVSWNDAQAYAMWISKQTGRAYRLPSEAEWEYCCRAGTTSTFSTGEQISIQQANFLFLDFGDRPGLGRPAPVASYAANAFGLYDMHGNICELVADAWHGSYAGAPDDGSSWMHQANGQWRVVRGGGWDAMPRILRSAFRDWVHRDQRLDNMGFRIACTL